MGLKDINTKKKPVVLVDKSLDFFNDKILFPKKLEKANEMLKKVFFHLQIKTDQHRLGLPFGLLKINI